MLRLTKQHYKDYNELLVLLHKFATEISVQRDRATTYWRRAIEAEKKLNEQIK